MLGFLAAITAGCTVAPPSQFYQLQKPVADVENQKNTATVLLGPLTIADYLQRESIIQRQVDGSLSISSQARWAGSIDNDIGQLLLRQVSHKLGTSRISLYPDRIGMEAQAQVVLSINRLDSGERQPAVLEAQWRLLDENGVLSDSRVVSLTQEHNGELGDQVRAQSDLLIQLAAQLASALEKTLPEQTLKPTKRAASTETHTHKPSQGSMVPLKIPVVEPVREQEVYRF